MLVKQALLVLLSEVLFVRRHAKTINKSVILIPYLFYIVLLQLLLLNIFQVQQIKRNSYLGLFLCRW